MDLRKRLPEQIEKSSLLYFYKNHESVILSVQCTITKMCHLIPHREACPFEKKKIISVFLHGLISDMLINSYLLK